MQGKTDLPWQWQTRRPLLRALDVLVLTTAAGILAALGHVTELAVARVVQGQLVWFSHEFVWMSPIAYTFALLPGGFVLALLALVSGRRWVFALAVCSLTMAAVFGMLLPYSQIMRAVSLFLALAVGVQVTRVALSSPLPAVRAGRRFAAAGAIAVAALAFLIPVVRGWRENRALANLTSAPADAPNILLLILDTVRAASFGLYSGAPATTPRMLQWAHEGVVFDNAWAPAPWTLPSHSSYFTGKYPGELDGDWKIPLGVHDSTLAEVLRARGYATGGFVGNLHYTSWDSGLNRGFGAYRDYRRSLKQILLSSSYTQTRLVRTLLTERSIGAALRALREPDLSIKQRHKFDLKPVDIVNAQFLDWQRSIGTRPYFAFLNYFDAHRPRYAPEAFRKFPKVAGDIDVYHAAIAWLDSEVGALLDTLRARGALDNTVVIVTADHGELFEEFGLSGHAHNLYRNVLWVPLYVRYPTRVPRDVRVTTPVSMRDLAATIVDLAGVQRSPLPGASLASTWASGAGAVATSPLIAEVTQAPNVDPAYRTSRGAMKSLTDSAWHYIRNGDGQEELFEWRVDPTRDLVARDGTDGQLAISRARLDSLLRSRKHRQ